MEKFNTSPDFNLEYVPINGNRAFIDGALGLAYGPGHRLLTSKRVASAQTMSGCGALYMGMQFIKQYGKSNVIYYSDPTWPIQSSMAEFLGFDARAYPYYDPKSISLDFNGMMNTLDTAPEGALVILHACAHNPTGFDLSHEQWHKVMELCVRKRLLPFFDMAYQGFASGDLSTDNWAVRLFADNDVPIFVGTSFAKNMGLYGTRTGTLSLVTENAKEATNVQSQLNKIARNTWSSCPLHGAAIADVVLKTPEIREIWDQDLLTMSGRILEMRKEFVRKLGVVGNKNDWSHILDQIGMFAFTGLSKPRCQELMDKHSVFLTLNGRISVCGLNEHNMDYTVNAFHEVSKNGRD